MRAWVSEASATLTEVSAVQNLQMPLQKKESNLEDSKCSFVDINPSLLLLKPQRDQSPGSGSINFSYVAAACCMVTLGDAATSYPSWKNVQFHLDFITLEFF